MNILLTADWLVRTTYYILFQHLDELGANTERVGDDAVVASFDEVQGGGQYLRNLAGSSK